MAGIMKYEAARAALAEALHVDEVKDIRDKAAALQEYAKHAKDTKMIEMATEIRLRAERRAGELLRDTDKNKGTRGTGDANVGKSTGGRDTRPPVDIKKKLSDMGISKDQSSQWQKLAAIPEDKFEEKIAAIKTKISAPKKKRAKAVRDKKPTEQQVKVSALNEAGKTTKEIAAEIGTNPRHVDIIKRVNEAYDQGIIDGSLNPVELPKGTQEKFEIWKRKEERRMKVEVEQRVREECQRQLEETFLPHYAKTYAEYQDIIKNRRGAMDRKTYNKILQTLHPDKIAFTGDEGLIKRHNEAFRLFSDLELMLLDEQERPTETVGIPTTYADLMALKEKVAAKRKAARGNGKSVGVPRV